MANAPMPGGSPANDNHAWEEVQTPGSSPAKDCPGLEEVDPAADPALAAEGWVARFLADNSRAAEVMEIYADLGFEVMTRPLAPEHVGPQCTACAETACPVYAMIYTRRRTTLGRS